MRGARPAALGLFMSTTDKLEYAPGARVPGTNYKVIRKIGAGGMGVVYEVEDISIEKRYVLKTIQARLAGRDDAVERFIREAKALAKLDHKNIVQVFTAGVTSDSVGLRYFVMEKLNGHSLRTVLDNKQCLELEAACRTTIELMGALDKAHEHGIVHRDIKPENIFLHRDGNGVTTLKLLDFGIMTSADARTVDRKGFVGTVRYAAPEQIQGQDVSASSDLYAATLVLYECIAGRGPFDEIVDFNQLVAAHMARQPPPLSVFRPGVPRALEELVARGLAKDPAERPPDAFTYAAELNRVRRALHDTSVPNPTALSTAHDLLAQEAASRARPDSATARDGGPLTGAPTPRLSPGHLQPAPPADALETRAEGRLVGATTPETSREGEAAAVAPLVADPMAALGGATVAGEPPQMTLGPEAMAAAAAREANAPMRSAPGNVAVDRNAPTGTYIPPHADPRSAARSGAGGDTLHMTPVEQQNLHPLVPGAVQKTTRMEPIPQAFGATTEPPELRVTSGNTSQSIGDPMSVRGGGLGAALGWIVAGLLGFVVVAGVGVFYMLHTRAPRASETPVAASSVVVATTASVVVSATPPAPSVDAPAPTVPASVSVAPPQATAPKPRVVHTTSDGELLETHRTSAPTAPAAPATAPRATTTSTATTRKMPGSGL